MMPLRWRGLLGLMLVCAWCTARADGLQVSPIGLDFAPGERVLALTVGNRGQDPLQVQVELKAWAQADGQERLEDSRAMLASPPQLRLEAGEQRVVRIGRRQIDSQACEHSFRLIVTEILPQPRGDVAPLRFRSRMVLPVFVRTQNDCPPALAARMESGRLSIHNTGSGHAKLSDLVLLSGDHSWTLSLKHLGYLLPGAWQQIDLPDDADLMSPRLRARTTQGSVDIPLQLRP